METKTSTSTPAIRKKKSARWRKAVPWVIGGGIAAFIIWGLLPRPTEVDMGRVTTGPLKVTVLEEGKTRIRHRYTISSPIPAYLQRVPLRPGAPVKEGETVLATLSPMPASFLDPRSLAQANAAIQSAEANLERLNSQKQSASSELDLAKKELKRNQQLKQTGAISQSQFDAAANQAEVLQRRLDAAEYAYKVASFELEQSRAALMQMDANSPGAGQPVEIRAPVSGQVLQVFEESARPLTPGQPIMELGDPTDLEAEIEMLSTDAVRIRPGAPVSIEQWGGGNPLPGKVVLVEPGGYTKVSALGVEEQRTLVRVDFDALPDGVFGDRFRVEARVTTWESKGVLQVPTGALFRRGNEWMTFLVEGGRARLQPVEIGHSSGVDAEILSGLTEGQQVILHPPDTIVDGSMVTERKVD